MVVAKIQSIYYNESDSHTVGYSNHCKQYCNLPYTYKLFNRNINDCEFKFFIADSEEIVRELIQEHLIKYLVRTIPMFDPIDFLIQYSHCDVVNNEFWIPCNIGKKYNLKTLEIN